MPIRRLHVFAAILLLFGTSRARAQEKGDLGVTMGFPASVGLLWHASNAVAIRPEFSVSGGDSNSSNSTSLTFGTGASLIVYGKARDNVRPYFSPRVTYTHGSLHADIPTSSGTTTRASSTTNAWTTTGSFGAQYSPNRHFSVFGEVGFGYGRTESTPLVPSQFASKTKASAWGSRTAVGVVVYP